MSCLARKQIHICRNHSPHIPEFSTKLRNRPGVRSVWTVIVFWGSNPDGFTSGLSVSPFTPSIVVAIASTQQNFMVRPMWTKPSLEDDRRGQKNEHKRQGTKGRSREGRIWLVQISFFPIPLQIKGVNLSWGAHKVELISFCSSPGQNYCDNDV